MSLGGDVAFEVVQPDYHEECGHYHYRSADCPERDRPCGSYLCCRDDGQVVDESDLDEDDARARAEYVELGIN